MCLMLCQSVVPSTEKTIQARRVEMSSDLRWGLSITVGGVLHSEASTIVAMVRQRCPRCRDGKIFRSSIYWGFPHMHDCCPKCGLRFNREPGYFLGAMYVSYGLALVVIVVFGGVLWGLTNWRVDKIAIWAVVLFLPFAPMLTLLSRVLWIYLDQALDPEK